MQGKLVVLTIALVIGSFDLFRNVATQGTNTVPKEVLSLFRIQEP